MGVTASKSKIIGTTSIYGLNRSISSTSRLESKKISYASTFKTKDVIHSSEKKQSAAQTLLWKRSDIKTIITENKHRNKLKKERRNKISKSIIGKPTNFMHLTSSTHDIMGMDYIDLNAESVEVSAPVYNVKTLSVMSAINHAPVIPVRVSSLNNPSYVNQYVKSIPTSRDRGTSAAGARNHNLSR
ncbi:hypothetical protein BDB01DRAFT_779173 [Pilobolus umbonatus]|nr:hypothetical protein BDB01DRAFT_779173 [Pilobolus umbonatus]